MNEVLLDTSGAEHGIVVVIQLPIVHKRAEARAHNIAFGAKGWMQFSFTNDTAPKRNTRDYFLELFQQKKGRAAKRWMLLAPQPLTRTGNNVKRSICILDTQAMGIVRQ